MSIFQVILGALRAVGKRLVKLFTWMWTILTSVITWVVAAVSWLVSEVWSRVQSAFQNAFNWVGENLDIDSFPVVSSFAQWVCIDLLAFDVAFSRLGALFLLWCAAKTSRLAMIPIKAVLALL